MLEMSFKNSGSISAHRPSPHVGCSLLKMTITWRCKSVNCGMMNWNDRLKKLSWSCVNRSINLTITWNRCWIITIDICLSSRMVRGFRIIRSSNLLLNWNYRFFVGHPVLLGKYVAYSDWYLYFTRLSNNDSLEIVTKTWIFFMFSPYSVWNS